MGLAGATRDPRILDTDLAERLGYARPREIRQLIKAHEAALEAMGVLRRVAAKSSDPLGRGRPATAYYLNKPQAIFITTQSGTATAIEIAVSIGYTLPRSPNETQRPSYLG